MTVTQLNSTERAVTFVLLVAGISVATIGILTLLGWALDAPNLHTWKVGTIPMSPLTALLSIMSGIALCLISDKSPGRLHLLLAKLLGGSGMMIALLFLGLRLLDIYLPGELLGLPIIGAFGDEPIGYISTISAFCFLFANAGLLALLSSALPRSWRCILGWCFGGLISLMNFAILLAYAFGMPLIAGNLLIQIGFNSNVSLTIIALALLALATRQLLQQTVPESGAIKKPAFILMFVIFTAGILAVVYQNYRETEIKFRNNVESQLHSVSKLKTEELMRWRIERLGDAALSQSFPISLALRRLLEMPNSKPAQQEMQDWLGRFLLSYGQFGYDRIVLLDTKGASLMSLPDTQEPLSGTLAERAAASLQSGRITLQDFYRDEHNQRVYLALIVPVLDTQHGNKPLGIIVLRIDPTIYVYPLLQSWPTPTASAETLLVRRDGNDVLYLNDLRFRADAALNLRINLSNTALPAAIAVLGQQGIVSGLDYRGKQVIAALNAVPDSPWHLVTKIDRSEVVAPLHGRILLSSLLVFLLIIGIGALTYLLWRQQSLKSALVLREQGERFQDILQTMLDGFLLLDIQGRVLETNKTYCQMSGYSEQELLAMGITNLEALESAKDVAAHIQKIVAQGQNRFESKHRRKDGSVFDVEVSVQFRTGEGKELVVFLHDISNRKMVQKTLSESEQKFRVMAEALPQIIWMTTADGLHIYFNPQWVNFTGLTLEESYGHGWITPFHPDDKQRAWDAWQQATQNDSIYSLECRLRRFDGTYRWWLIRGESLHDTNGKVINWFGTCTDIQDMKESEENLKLAASVFTHAREGIMITSSDRKIIRVNDAFSEITGYSPDEVLGHNPRLLSSGLHENEFYDALWADLNMNDQWHGEIWNRRKNGEIYAVLQNISAVRDTQGIIQQYVALMTDITLIKEHEHVLEHSAHFDMLTGLPNRALLSDRLQQGIAQTKRREQGLAVAFLDLDGFKGVNDKHGHLIGDQLLKTLSDNMKQVLREIDTLARIGGDEFVAVLLDIGDIEACEPMLTRLLAAAAKLVQFGDISLQVSASLGVSFYPQKNEVDPDLLVRQADQAMYQAKLMGKNRFHVFNAELDNLTRARHESLERIRQALATHEFVLYYQPKVNIRKGLVVGAEALVRWQHPDKGLLAPADFLPLIDNHPLAIELGEWVIDTALNQIENWHKTGFDIPVSVNIGARHLQQNDFVARLCALLAAHPAIKPGRLELEVLETSAMEDLARASQIIKDCHEMGVMFALDDFGTGYSSLTYLKRLPVGQIKIDQSFVRDMLEDPDDLAILEGVIKLSGSFRRQVIAEGVETVEHGVMLLQLGCELAQGFGIAHPMPASDLQSWAAVWRPDPAWINVPSVSRDDIPLLFAKVEHRAWIVKLEAYLNAKQEAPPPMNPHQCPFGLWLDNAGRALHTAHPAFLKIEPLHQQIHALAAKLLELHANGRNTEAIAKLGELHALRDALLEQLNVLVQEHWQQVNNGTGVDE